MTTAAAIAFVLVGLAELGDKSQLMLVGFAARHRPLKVLAGAAIAVAVLQALAVLGGGLIGAYLPQRLIAFVAGALFIVFGVMAWRGDDDEEGHGARLSGRFGAVLTVAAALFVAELGDKTQVLTMSIAADPAAAVRTLGALGAGVTPPEAGSAATGWGVWLGSSLGFLLADAIAIGAGAVLGARLPERRIARVSSVIFIVFGLATLVSAFVAR
ncbi:TMEM165/GDT1 family protein [Anaerosoma tenue]|uniref:TMEM165/GDT1 family protein n=1 Tax=Anaerosoma tenue TaxID=2933588 RepID=UPI002260FECE|nr:TMEM165/GDT1 family protein [Anaerosoma tenue]MCK8114453.1 TMEM165/GDT1 family protein [Anaerosoma tenue]